MKRFLVAGLLAIPLVAICVEDASAFFSICGQKSCTYSIVSPRICFGFDWGPQPCCGPVAASPLPPALPVKSMIEVPMPHAPVQAAPVSTTQPASYWLNTDSNLGNSYYNPAQAGYSAPSYWYGR
jgi:hypothetical protein